MANPIGLFDATAAPLGWFSESAQPAGWFDRDLLAIAEAGGSGTLTTSLSAAVQQALADDGPGRSNVALATRPAATTSTDRSGVSGGSTNTRRNTARATRSNRP